MDGSRDRPSFRGRSMKLSVLRRMKQPQRPRNSSDETPQPIRPRLVLSPGRTGAHCAAYSPCHVHMNSRRLAASLGRPGRRMQPASEDTEPSLTRFETWSGTPEGSRTVAVKTDHFNAVRKMAWSIAWHMNIYHPRVEQFSEGNCNHVESNDRYVLRLNNRSWSFLRIFIAACICAP